ncbi:MAG: hypothetical protein KY463_06650, partial [Actinobacteria bacterium]|nr:hypothetical protein [Actinomycetota bacterium]
MRGAVAEHHPQRAVRRSRGVVGCRPLRVVRLDAEGRAFCVGGDLHEFAAVADPAAHVAELAAAVHDGLTALHGLPVPVVGVVQGVAAGGGSAARAPRRGILSARHEEGDRHDAEPTIARSSARRTNARDVGRRRRAAGARCRRHRRPPARWARSRGADGPRGDDRDDAGRPGRRRAEHGLGGDGRSDPRLRLAVDQRGARQPARVRAQPGVRAPHVQLARALR